MKILGMIEKPVPADAAASHTLHLRNLFNRIRAGRLVVVTDKIMTTRLKQMQHLHDSTPA